MSPIATFDVPVVFESSACCVSSGGNRAACSQEIGQLGHRGIGLFAALPCICSRLSYGIGI